MEVSRALVSVSYYSDEKIANLSVSLVLQHAELIQSGMQTALYLYMIHQRNMKT